MHTDFQSNTKMGLLGMFYHLAALGLSITTSQEEKIGEHIQKAKQSLAKTAIDPIGISDVHDIIKKDESKK